MNYRAISFNIGRILAVEAALLIFPAIGSIIYRDGTLLSFAITIAALTVCSLAALSAKPKSRTLHARDGYVIVALSWILMSLFGALPFVLSGHMPNLFDAFFETVSGFTTTGSTCLRNVEVLPRSLLFWRSFTHWLGGMGVLVFMLAIVPMSGESIYLLRAESPGPSVSKMVPKMRTSSLILYAIYFGMTVLQILLFRLGVLCGWGEMPWLDTFCITFGSAGTGGFAVLNDGCASYSPYIQAVTTIFMALFGVNFSVYFFLLCRKFKLAWNNSEVRWYFIIILLAIALITGNLILTGGYFKTVREAVHHVAFSVSSVITTTGFGTEDFATWPEFSRVILGILMIIGACAGSTGGGIKVSRLLLLCKSARRELRLLLHPHAVEVIRMDGKRVSNEVVRGTQGYLIVYVLLVVFSTLLLSLEENGIETGLSATLATLNNIGPGLSVLIGPSGTYGAFSPFGKLLLIFNMLCGRLELFPMLVLLRPSTWVKH